MHEAVFAPKLYFEVGKKLARETSSEVTYPLEPHDITPEFSSTDSNGSFGTVGWAYSSRRDYYLHTRTLPDELRPLNGGYVPMRGMVRIHLTNKFAKSGVTMIFDNEDTKNFTGRIIIFTHNRAFSEQVNGRHIPRGGSSELLSITTVHEFVHALGFPHKCGYWDWVLPHERSCCMNYFNHGLLDETRALLDANGSGRRGAHLCARHIEEIRKARLHEHRGLQWQW